MLVTALRYFSRHPVLAFGAVASHPREAVMRLYDVYLDRRERRGVCRYEAVPDWEQRLHRLLGIAFPCAAIQEFTALWHDVVGSMRGRGLRVGPETFLGWNDGDPGLVRAIWCLVRHLRPSRVIETGVAHGFTSRFILEALERNGEGHLWSIDLPPLDPVLGAEVGVAVEQRHPARWSYIRGTSRQRLPRLIAEVGEIDLFVHDSLHSEHNLRFELDRAWAALRPGGAIVVDDMDVNWGFRSFLERFSGHRSLVCVAEPLSPDLRRFNGKGLFGIIVKDPPASQAEPQPGLC